MAKTVHTLSYVDFLSDDGLDLDLYQVQSHGFTPGLDNLVNAGSGQPNPTMVGTQAANPTMTITAVNLQKVLDNIALDGAPITYNGTSSPIKHGCKAWLQEMAHKGVRGSSHINVQFRDGLVVPRTLNASQGQGEATIDIEMLLSDPDDGNDPVIMNTGQSMSDTPSASRKYKLGPVSLNGTDLRPNDISIDFGLQEEVRADSGEMFPSYVGIVQRRPTITITVDKADVLGTTGILGADITTLDIYLRRVDDGAGQVPDADSKHIQITVNKGIVQPGDQDWSQGDAATVPLEVTPAYDGSNDILTINTATAIS